MEFPLLKKQTSLGVLPDVGIPVEILTRAGYQRVFFLLDTGADFSMLPAYITEWIGLDLSTCRRDTSYGIEGGKGVTVWAGKIPVKIGRQKLKIRCLFSKNEACPYILGRADIFDHFNIFFDNKRKRIVLTKITADG